MFAFCWERFIQKGGVCMFYMGQYMFSHLLLPIGKVSKWGKKKKNTKGYVLTSFLLCSSWLENFPTHSRQSSNIC